MKRAAAKAAKPRGKWRELQGGAVLRISDRDEFLRYMAKAALAGGATQAEVNVLMRHVRLPEGFGAIEVPVTLDFAAIVAMLRGRIDEALKIAKKRRMEANIAGANAAPVTLKLKSGRVAVKAPVTPQERAAVEAANTSLMRKYPVPGTRQRAIGEQLNMKVGRVRYILTGPRRGKK